MERFGRALALLWVVASTAAAQPYIKYRGVVNAASYAPQGLPGGGIARGSIFTIFGRSLGPAEFQQPSAFPLQNELAGVSVQVIQGSTSLAAIPVFVSSAQVSAIMPSNAPLGTASVRVRFSNRTSNPARVRVVESAVGIFSVLSAGFGPAVALNVSEEGQALNTTRFTARPGQRVDLYGTGLGAAPHPDNIAPQGGNLPVEVEIFVGGQRAEKLYAGRTGCCAGLDQIVFNVPRDAPAGCFVPLQIRTNGAAVSVATTISIEPGNRPCADSFNPLGEALRAGGRIGIVAPRRTDIRLDQLVDAPVTTLTDRIDAALVEEQGGELYFNQLASLPPVGSCTFYAGTRSRTLADLIAQLASQTRLLDGGTSLQLSGSGPAAALERLSANLLVYRALLGRQPGASPLFFSFPGSFRFLIPGGSDVRPAQSDFATGEALVWTNRDSLAEVDRARGLTLNWTGGDASADIALAGVISSDDASNASALGLCVAPIGAGSLSIPAEILAGLPPTRPAAVQVPAWVFVAPARVRNPSRFTAPGLDSVFILPSQLTGRSAVVR